jgi:large subunit ribosomal protein L3
MIRKLLGKKCGMVRVFDHDGAAVACTLLYVGSNVVTQVKSRENDGYEAIQLAFDEINTDDPRTVEKRVTKPLIGHFAKAKVAPHRHLHEMKVDDASQYALGQKVDLATFEGVARVDVSGISKGKGYQGLMKKNGFKGMPKSHGAGPVHRHAGSTGMRSSPGRCLPGGPRPSRMGGDKTTIQRLRVVSIDLEKGVILVEGAVPGAKNGIVVLSSAVKEKTKG